jgi:uncharacterized protein (DUF58 family)
VPPGKGRRHALRIIRDVLVHQPEGKGTDIGGALEYLNRLLPHRAIVFLISDLIDPGIERPLKFLARRHDVVVAPLEDPSEWNLPDIGVARFVDPETGQVVSVDTSDRRVREGFKNASEAERAARRQLLRRLAIDEVPVNTKDGYLEALLKFFRARGTRVRRRW